MHIIFLKKFSENNVVVFYHDSRSIKREYTISFLSLISNSTGLKEHRISAQQKALAISGKAERHKLST